MSETVASGVKRVTRDHAVVLNFDCDDCGIPNPPIGKFGFFQVGDSQGVPNAPEQVYANLGGDSGYQSDSDDHADTRPNSEDEAADTRPNSEDEVADTTIPTTGPEQAISEEAFNAAMRLYF
ncbi:hypothetical protein H4R33_005339 [Dimargaris cristalligena]|nr:hypothetical protein H4R33_005339 [Dimargaris cristalligena]